MWTHLPTFPNPFLPAPSLTDLGARDRWAVQDEKEQGTMLSCSAALYAEAADSLEIAGEREASLRALYALPPPP
jgi:hypothetical protein